MSITDLEVTFDNASENGITEAYMLSPNIKVHSEISSELDYDHEAALETLLKDCTDEQLISEIARRQLDIQHKVTKELVAKYYHFEKIIGTGASGKVYLVYHRDTNEPFACKVIKKDGSMNDAQSMTTEIEIMKRIRHRHIVSLYELFESAQCMWLILELVEGTGLRGVLADIKHYSEVIAARYIRQILLGIHYLHNHGVIHRDLKLDNMLLHGEVANGLVKIADFGLSALIKPGTKGYHAEESQRRKDYKGLTDMWGTPTHYSPELIQKAYGPQSDMWSLGCMMFEMLTGGEAFPSHDAHDRKDLYNRIKHGRYSRDCLKDISLEAQNLIGNILEPDPLKRFSASEALAHPWITGEGHFETHQKHLLTASNSFRIHSTSRSHNTPTTPTHANNIPSPTSNSAAAAITPTAAAAAAATAAAVISSINSNKPTVSTKPTISIRSNSNSNKPSTSSTTTTANSSRMNTTNSSRNSVTSSSCSSSGSNLVSSTPRSPTRKPIRVGLPEINVGEHSRKKADNLSPLSRSYTHTL